LLFHWHIQLPKRLLPEVVKVAAAPCCTERGTCGAAKVQLAQHLKCAAKMEVLPSKSWFKQEKWMSYTKVQMKLPVKIEKPISQ
jgi:hypothetical protein